jgi:hypothetical protein
MPAPPFGQQYPPGGGVPEGKKRNNVLFFGSIAGGVIAAVVVVAVILAVTGVFASPDPKATAAKRLSEAAKALGGYQSAKYKGTVTSGADSLVGDFKVISNGSVSADVTWGGDQAQFIDVDGSVFVKSDANYWKTTANYQPIGSAATVDTSKWGRRGGDSISFNFQQLTPGNVASAMRGKTKKDIVTTVKTNYGGGKALKVSTGTYVYYLTADGPARLLRVEDHGAINYALDVDAPGGANAMSELQTSINQLSDSFDATAIVVPGAYSDVSFTPSSASLKQKITVTHPTGGGSQTSVTAVYGFFKDQAGNNKIDQCTATGTPGSDGSLQLSCSASDSDWTSFASGAANGVQIWYKYVSFTVGGATSGDIQTLLKDLTSPATGGGGSGSSGQSSGGGISG